MKLWRLESRTCAGLQVAINRGSNALTVACVIFQLSIQSEIWQFFGLYERLLATYSCWFSALDMRLEFASPAVAN